MAQPPEIFVLSGPNGAGKSTTAGVLLPEGFDIKHFVNADVIAETLAAGSSAIDAGRIMLKNIHEHRDRRETFAFATTLAAKSYVPFLQDAQRAG